MILQIDENYRITSDEHNFVLEKKRTSKKGHKERWSVLGYWKSLDHVLECVRDEKIKNLGKSYS
ncbi:hypothetical protein MYX84_16315 [Acidobacteria bacterium AH-259-O06]|nr:hypothetical protein [Acidobacteria bacterium AH-259-O06]